MSYMSAARANAIEIDMHALYEEYLAEEEEPMGFTAWLYSADADRRETAMREYFMEGPDA